MKLLITAAVLAALCLPVQAQLFRPAAVNGAILGGVAGAIIGNNSHGHNAWRGAAIGAGAGLVLGSIVDESHGRHGYYRPVAHYPSRYYGPRYGYYYGYAPTVTYAEPYPVAYRSYTRPSYASQGLFWGGLTGAIIGYNNNHHHNAWRGAAWGAGAGLLLGSILDAESRPVVVERAPEVVYTTPAPQAAPASQPPQNVTIINNYYNTPATPMSAANSMFGR